MHEGIYWGWGLLLPLFLSALWGGASLRAMATLKSLSHYRLRVCLLAFLSTILWSMVQIPLPLFYLITFACYLFPLHQQAEFRAKEWFLIGLFHLCFMVIQLSVIGVTAIVVSRPMATLLQNAVWRIFSISITLALGSVLLFLLPRFELPLAVLRSQAGSEEVKPFLLFLRLCSIFLFLDSILCLSPLEWPLLPVLLLGSTILVGFLVTRILFHIYHLLKIRYLEEEHHRLQAELGAKEQFARELEKQSQRDPLTQTYSRTYLLHEIASRLAQRRPFSLVYLDLDRLKAVNDQYGHQAGDEYLIQFSALFQTKLRKTDIFARIGGDEFAVLIPDCSQEDAQERIRQIRTALELAPDSQAPRSFSYGVAGVSSDSHETAAQIMNQADQAMYQDKRRARS